MNILWRGPSQKALPAFLYLSSTAKKSLDEAPLNEVIKALEGSDILYGSVDLPYHDEKHSAKESLQIWADLMAKGIDPLSDFILSLKEQIDLLYREGRISSLALGGISRGALIALLLASQCPQVSHILCFAPLISFESIRAFAEIDIPQSLRLGDIQVEALSTKKMRSYIGNRDQRVGTERSFKFMQTITEKAYANHRGSPPIELRIHPSIGAGGHGSPRSILKEGGEWIREQLVP